jgi:NADH-quinone oxidoreductase subunit M
VYTFETLAVQGAVMQMLAHGIATAALFMVAGGLQERLHTRDMERMGGLWDRLPRIGAIALLFAIAALGLPGFGNFVGEFLVLLGTYRVSPAVAGAAVLGPVAAVLYALALVQRTFHGPPRAGIVAADYTAGETAVMGLLAGLIIMLGVYPQPVFDLLAPVLPGLAGSAAVAPVLAGGLP